MGIVATRMTEIRAALALGMGALLKWGPFRAWIGPRLKLSGKCRSKRLCVAETLSVWDMSDYCFPEKPDREW